MRLGEKTPLPVYLRALWQRRDFAVTVPLGELRAQNMDTVLGNLWHLLNPVLLVAVYFTIFGLLLDTSRGVDNFLAFLAVGVFVYQYSQRTAIAAAKSIPANEGLIRSIQFPRALLPISTVIGQTVAFMPAVAVMVVVALATGERPTLRWLLLGPIFLLQSAFNLGAALVVARLADSFRDVQNILPFVFRLLFYMSGVLYLVEAWVGDPALRRLFNANPLYAFVTLARGPVLGEPSNPELWMSVLVWTAVILPVGFAFFRAGEQRYGRG